MPHSICILSIKQDLEPAVHELHMFGEVSLFYNSPKVCRTRGKVTLRAYGRCAARCVNEAVADLSVFLPP